MGKEFQDRAAGALMGAFVGDALALGPHWYYDLAAMRRDYGEWISDYTAPKAGRYHAGLKAGDLSQAGYILSLTLASLTESGAYDEQDFCQRMDTELFPRLSGEPDSGPGGYTSQSIREAYRKRIGDGRPWGEIAGQADTTEAVERTLAIAVRYANSPERLVTHVAANTALTQNNELVIAMTTAFGAVLGHLVQGHRLTADISSALMEKVASDIMPFHASAGEQPEPAPASMSRAGQFASPEPLLTPGEAARAAQDNDIHIEPAWKIASVYGLPCAIYHQLPAAYYLATRFADYFEEGVLHAVNGGGQNQSRAILTGALIGAQCGLSGIPERFITGLSSGNELRQRVCTLAQHADDA